MSPGRARSRLALTLASVSFVLPALARADTAPTVWDRARRQELGDSYALHLEVERRLAQRDNFEVRESQVLAVRAMLERAGAERSPDPRLRFDLGTVLLLLHDYARSATVLEGALAEAPDHPAAEEAWLRLAFACGHIGRHACERRAYIEVLKLVTEDVGRATPTLNLAETEMHLGNLHEAVEGYREALRIAGRVPSRETAPLAVWGLAVALDRSGDRPGAEREARFAQELERSMGLRHLLRSSDVFFVPDYEVHWYEGLGATTRARNTTSTREAIAAWREAEQAFFAYVQAGERAQDRWLEIARIRLATAQTERGRAEKRLAKERQEQQRPWDDDLLTNPSP